VVIDKVFKTVKRLFISHFEPVCKCH